MTYKDQCKIYEKEIEELQKQIEQLSIDNHVLKTAFITQRKLIEELKCCGNCKYWKNESIQKYCVITEPNFLIKKQIDKCDKWESVE